MGAPHRETGTKSASGRTGFVARTPGRFGLSLLPVANTAFDATIEATEV